MNDVLETMAAHRSVRHYLPDPLPADAIAAAVRAAQQASTSSWIQAYALIQIEDRATRARLRVLTGDQEQVERAGAFFVVAADGRRHRLVAERDGAPRAPNLETFLLGVVDASLFAQNLALAFESLGYGICFIGGLRNRLPEVDRLLELPYEVLPLFGLCVGRPAPGETAEGRPRLPLEAVWMRERYLDDAALLAAIDAHDREAAETYDRRGLPGRTWSGGVWRKFRRPVREHLLAYYESKGARLR